MKRTSDGSLDPTLTPTEAPTQERPPELTAPSISDAPPARAPSNYKLGELLGRGGMGEVVLAEDKMIGRRVAIKRMRADQPTPEAVARFLREARIQAHLDHPAIVPVHELGNDEDGRPYFTMKRLAGVTLHDVLQEGKATPQKLLRAFVDVCLAIEFAHQRGVVHRDLKPSNIMLGDYGEVYVLDWGVARVTGEAELGGVAIASLDGETQQGDVLGTPGYMSPEQMRGDEITPATDVYALGAILFEILVGAPLHPRGAAMQSTLSGTKWSPASRAPDRAIAPEIDLACTRALLASSADRPSAGELAEQLQRYLDGDRDVERRRQLAADELVAARSSLAANDRVDAMRRAGRALALVPDSRDAAALVSQLMLEPPSPPPPALAKRLAEIDLDDMTRQGHYAGIALGGYLLFLPVMALIGVRDWSVILGIAALVVVMMIGALLVARRRIPTITWALFGNAFLMLFVARMFGPIILGPALGVATATALGAFPTMRVSMVLVTISLSVTLPLALEEAGLLPRLAEFSSTSITVMPGALDFGAASSPLFLSAAHVSIIVIVGLVVRRLANARLEAQRKLEGQSWMLEQLLPVEC